MNEVEKYKFDLDGYLLVKGLLEPEHVQRGLAAADAMHNHISVNIDAEPRYLSSQNVDYRFDEEYQCHSYKSMAGGGVQYIIDDFLNASEAFDVLVNHEPTMKYIRDLCAGPYRIVSSELRCRHKSNTTPTHMGGPMDTRNKYEFAGRSLVDTNLQKPVLRDFNLNVVRVLYALHDVPTEQGPLCVVPGSHKANFYSPFDRMDPREEPGMIPLPMQAGDAIIFTENLRHGGFPNLMEEPRRTLHIAIGPRWIASQSPLHWDEQVYVSPQAWARYTDLQRALLPPPPAAAEREAHRLREEVRRLKADNARLLIDIQQIRGGENLKHDVREGLFQRVRRAIGRSN
jgi:hypothetical protein